MRIISLTAENVKRLKAVRITPDGTLVQITGRNGQGKTSVLDAISYALAGKSAQPVMPIRKGEKQAKVVLDLGDKVVTRTWSEAGNTYLAVESPDGAKYPSPQALLDKLVGQLTFDPLAFVRLSPAEQVSALKSLAGLDFTNLDNERAAAYYDRTVANRQLKVLEAQTKTSSDFDGVPDAEVDLSQFAKLQADAVAALRANDNVRNEALQAEQQLSRANADAEAFDRRCADEHATIQKTIADLEDRLSRAKKDEQAWQERVSKEGQTVTVGLDNLREKVKTSRATVDALVDPDLAPIAEAVSAAEAINHRVRDKQRYTEQMAAVETQQATVAALSARIEQIDAEKAAALAAAKLPTAGVSFDGEGLLLNDIPFSQASSAEQLRTSVAMGVAMNPTLRIMLIRDGSLLDADGLKTLGELAEQHDMQVWIERVADGQPVGIVIEDGEVAGGSSPEDDTA